MPSLAGFRRRQPRTTPAGIADPSIATIVPQAQAQFGGAIAQAGIVTSQLVERRNNELAKTDLVGMKADTASARNLFLQSLRTSDADYNEINKMWGDFKKKNFKRIGNTTKQRKAQQAYGQYIRGIVPQWDKDIDNIAWGVSAQRAKVKLFNAASQTMSTAPDFNAGLLSAGMDIERSKLLTSEEKDLVLANAVIDTNPQWYLDNVDAKPIPKPTQKLTSLTDSQEQKFQTEFAKVAEANNININPDDPLHFYDYRALFEETGELKSTRKHFPSKFKLLGHPNLIVDGKDTRTGEKATKSLIEANKKANETVTAGQQPDTSQLFELLSSNQKAALETKARSEISRIRADQQQATKLLNDETRKTAADLLRENNLTDTWLQTNRANMAATDYERYNNHLISQANAEKKFQENLVKIKDPFNREIFGKLDAANNEEDLDALKETVNDYVSPSQRKLSVEEGKKWTTEINKKREELKKANFNSFPEWSRLMDRITEVGEESEEIEAVRREIDRAVTPPPGQEQKITPELARGLRTRLESTEARKKADDKVLERRIRLGNDHIKGVFVEGGLLFPDAKKKKGEVDTFEATQLYGRRLEEWERFWEINPLATEEQSLAFMNLLTEDVWSRGRNRFLDTRPLAAVNTRITAELAKLGFAQQQANFKLDEQQINLEIQPDGYADFVNNVATIDDNEKAKRYYEKWKDTRWE